MPNNIRALYFLMYQVQRNCAAVGLDPVLSFLSFVEGKVRQDWAEREELWRQDGRQVTWQVES
jgi:hypothetical protein